MVGSQIDKLVELSLNHFSVGVVGVCQVIKRAKPTFNKVEVLNLYLSVVMDCPKCLYGNIRFWTLQALISCWRMEVT